MFVSSQLRYVSDDKTGLYLLEISRSLVFNEEYMSTVNLLEILMSRPDANTDDFLAG